MTAKNAYYLCTHGNPGQKRLFNNWTPGQARNDGIHNEKEQGFTLIELLVYIILTVMMSTLVFQFMLDFWGSAATLENDSETFVTRQDAGDALRERLNVGSHLLDQNSISDPNAMVSDTTNYWHLINAIPGSITLPASGSYKPVFYFNAPSVDSSKNFIMNGAQPYYDEFILYLNGTTKQLLLRTLVNPGASGDRLKTSCPAPAATTSCPADTIIADDVTSVGTRYFSRSGNTIDWTSVVQTDSNGNPVVPTVYIGPDFPSVEVVEVTLHLSRRATLSGAQLTSNETIIRVALRNQ